MRAIPVSISENSRTSAYHLRSHAIWLDFNRRLTEDAQRLSNEARCERWLKELVGIEVADPRLFWLTLARLAELALKQAGDYADNCEFQAAGDLLANPRRIEIFVQGRTVPVIKNRHCGMREQFAAAIGREDPAAWLSLNTLSHVYEKALIPQLKDQLASSGWMHPDYLAMLDHRMCRVADTIAFLTAWQIVDYRELSRRMERAASEDSAMIEANCCRFDFDCFNEMADDIEKISCDTDTSSRFLDEHDFSPLQ